LRNTNITVGIGDKLRISNAIFQIDVNIGGGWVFFIERQFETISLARFKCEREE